MASIIELLDACRSVVITVIHATNDHINNV